MNAAALDALRGLFSGLVVGAAFAMVGAPIPAPPTLGGVLGVVGIAVGWAFVVHVKGLR